MDKQNLDIVFVQQANESLIKQLKNKNNQYVLFQKQKSQSIIVCKRSKFNKFYKIDPLQHHPQLKAKLNWNNDTVVAFVDNLILISGHLSSKKQKNPAQMHDMIQSLKALSQMYPMCHIISGCDANAYIYESLQTYFKQNQHSQKKQITQIEKQTQIKKQSQVSSLSTLSKKLSEAKSYIPSSWQIYPKKAQQFTTSKQRTFLQPQVSKAQQVARVCRDYLILVKNQESADIKFEQRKICTIFNKNPEDVPNLPCQQHPYDHYVIKADIAVNVLTNFDK